MHRRFGPCVSIGIGDADRLLAAVLYTDYTGHSIQLSIAAESVRWCSRRTVKEIFSYPFNDLACLRVTALVASDNTRSISLVERTGWKKEGLLRKGFGDVDMIVYGMLREECRWL